MKKRIITAVVYVIVLIGLLAMKLFIPEVNGLEYGTLGMDVLFWAISVIGAYEFMRAIGVKENIHYDPKSVETGEVIPAVQRKGGISKAQRGVVLATCVLIIPSFVITKMVATAVGAASAAVPALIVLLAVTSVGAMVVASLTVFDHYNSDVTSTAYAELCILYCGALTAVGPNLNHFFSNSDVAIVLLVFICPAVDTFAFFFGKLFGKFLPYKLAPKTSPNKTIIGAFGGVVGGIFAATLVWILCEFTPIMSFEYSGNLPQVVVLILISIPVSVFAQLGDLFESAIKRGCGVKDMGNLLPGHGGILDRFDSTLFASVAIAVCFLAFH